MKFKLLTPNGDYIEFEANLEDFHSKKVVYHKPEVWRLWMQVGEYRVNLHKIFKSETKELFHPHPWPMVTSIIRGKCEVGFGFGREKPEIANLSVFEAGSSYSMINPLLWHYVAPLSESILTIMVSGKPWNSEAEFNIHPTSAQPELSQEEKEILWNELTSLVERQGLNTINY